MRSTYELECLVDSFDRSARVTHQGILVIDNSGVLPVGVSLGKREMKIVHSPNKFWEFSAMLQGLEDLGSLPASGVLTILNDSFQRNWIITGASRRYVEAMYRAASLGNIAGWLDNFSLIRPPRFSRRPNSRLIVVANSMRSTMAASLARAITRFDEIRNAGGVLFDSDERDRIRAWFSSQGDRWGSAASAVRLGRVFIEHHMFDEVPRDRLCLFPRTYAETLFYGAARRLLGERR